MKGGLGSATLVFLGVFCCLVLYGAIPSRPQKKEKDKDRVYLIHADELRYDKWRNNDAQVLIGDVHFEHDGANLYCDSANFFEQSNSFEAWGNVRMVQGDTLSLTSDYGYYDGNNKFMEAKTMNIDHKVVLKNRTATLTTDQLYFDRIDNLGYYDTGGKLVDKTTTLTSIYGEYHTDTKDAFFTDNVKMVDKRFDLTTDTLVYNTRTKLAHIVGPSDIVSGRSHIYSEKGCYNTDTEQAELLERSRLDNDGRTLVGDSLWHDGRTGISEAFMNVVYNDTVNKNMLFCNYGFYNDSTGYAMCTDSAMSVDFSQRDSLFIHADTFKVFTYNIDTDSVFRVMHGYHRVRAYRTDVQAVCDSMVYNSKDSCLTLYVDPILWNINQQLLGEEIQVFMKDSVIDRAHVINQAFSIEELTEPELYNQVSSKEMFAFFTNGEIHEAQAKDNVLVAYYPAEKGDTSYVGLVSMETSLLRMFLEQRKLQRIWTPKSDGVMYPMSQIPPAKRYLENFQWFDYVRPTSKQDIFVWRGKKEGTELKKQKKMKE
jgi:lipopolysaccharide export system protein LptA